MPNQNLEKIELSTGSHTDSITRKTNTGWYLYIESDVRVYFISFDTILEIANFLRARGLVV